jgi:hypothetical protein
MTFTEAENAYLASQRLGRRPHRPRRQPQVKPVGFYYNPKLGMIGAAGFTGHEPEVPQRPPQRQAALVVDDIASANHGACASWEIRGTASAPSLNGRRSRRAPL